jgi:hypothetical protein
MEPKYTFSKDGTVTNNDLWVPTTSTDEFIDKDTFTLNFDGLLNLADPIVADVEFSGNHMFLTIAGETGTLEKAK